MNAKRQEDNAALEWRQKLETGNEKPPPPTNCYSHLDALLACRRTPSLDRSKDLSLIPDAEKQHQRLTTDRVVQHCSCAIGSCVGFQMRLR